MKPVITKGPLLRERTTLRLGGTAIAEVRLDDMHAFEALPEVLSQLGGRPVVLGRGSNILASDGVLPLVLVTSGMKADPAVTVPADETGHALIRSEAGVALPLLLRRLAEWGITGLEGLVGVPGTVGGAMAMNAGAYGCDMGKVLHSVEVFSLEEGPATYSVDQCRCAYRYFSIPTLQDWFIITAVTLRMATGVAGDVAKTMQANMARKKATQPLTDHTAGCVFQNPGQGVSAGLLLDEAGCKGRAIGGMRFSSLHANFLVNEGNGTSAEAFELIELAQDIVLERTGHDLSLEVKLIS